MYKIGNLCCFIFWRFPAIVTVKQNYHKNIKKFIFEACCLLIFESFGNSQMGFTRKGKCTQIMDTHDSRGNFEHWGFIAEKSQLRFLFCTVIFML